MKSRSSILWLQVVTLAICVSLFTAGCGGGGGGSTSSTAPTVSTSTGTTGGNTTTSGAASTTQPTAVGTAVCESCHTTFPSANGYQAGDAMAQSPVLYDAMANSSIPKNYEAGVHSRPPATNPNLNPTASLTDYTTCEGCHGNGSQHYGVGPIPVWAPGDGVENATECEMCHWPGGDVYFDDAAFDATRHANPVPYNGTNGATMTGPNQFFFVSGPSDTIQADYHGQPEWADAAGTVPVTNSQHIEECSMCHGYQNVNSLGTKHIKAGDIPADPQVQCSACHDAHNPANADATRNEATSRSTDGKTDAPVPGALVPNFKPQRVNNTVATAGFGGKDLVKGTWIRPRVYYDWHKGGDPAQTFSGYNNEDQITLGNALNGAAQGNDNLRLSAERLCVACHTKTQYKYARAYGTAGILTAITSTHETDVYTQFLNSSHADPDVQADGTDSAFWNFSLKNTVGSSHRPHYPVDMGGVPGQNGWKGVAGTTVAFDGRLNGGADVAQCFQCHNGVAAISYLDGTVWASALGDEDDNPTTSPRRIAQIVWGDSTLTCITCHDPHKDPSATGKNIRVPVSLSWNTEFTPGNAPPSQAALAKVRGTVNKFMDLSKIPSGLGDSQICLDCHQGRESGWTTWNKVRRQVLANVPGTTEAVAEQWWYNNPNTAIPGGISFNNNHYLDAGAMLFGRNLTEFKGKTYSSGIPSHLMKNCVGCHMDTPTADNTQGGHTWVPQIATCQKCHEGWTDFGQSLAPGDYDGNGTVGIVTDELGSVTVIAAGTGHISLATGPALYGSGTGGTGLMGLLNEDLWDSGIEYDPGAYPYFYTAGQPHTFANQYKAWTPNTMAAAENLHALYKSGNPGEQGYFFHNPYYSAQILIDSIEALPTWNAGDNAFDGAPHTQGTKAALYRPNAPDNDPNGTVTTHTGRDYSTGSFDPTVDYP